MNLRLVMFLCCGATLGLLQGGCASTPTTTDTDMRPVMHGLGDKPQMAFPGATRDEVKALAMGAARSRAWTIVSSTDDQMVVQRRLDASSPAAERLAASGAPSTGLIEVQSFFVDARGGVKVALEATVVSGGQGPGSTRSDVTEAFRPSLMESLESLHASWTKNRARIARAAPTTESTPADAGSALDSDVGLNADDNVSDSGAGSDSLAGPIVDAAPRTPTPTAWADEPVSSGFEPLPTRTQSTSVPGLASSSTTSSATASPAPGRPVPNEPEPIVLATQYPQQSTPTGSGASAPIRTPEPRRNLGGPAPVVDASPRRVSVTSGAISQPMTLPEPVPQLPPVAAPLPGSNAMMALPASVDTVSWSYYAEQYARLRGCQVTPQGAILIDSRSDGEVHKVPCDGADSLLVQCQNGECRGLL